MSTESQNFLEKEIQDSFEARKRLFIGLITGTSVLVCLILLLLWYIPYVGLDSIHPWAPWVMGTVVALAIGFIFWVSLGLVLNILLKRPVLYSRNLRGISIKFFLPLMTIFGRLLRIPKQKIRASFIKVNNELVLSESRKYPPDKVLMLMPHCLQNSICSRRLTYNVNNCKRCGECSISGLLDLSSEYGVHMAIATGGTIARRIVVNIRPRLIVAVACERDLSSGIQDAYPIPVYGVLNERPKGPCLDTRVTLEHVRLALDKFVDVPMQDSKSSRRGADGSEQVTESRVQLSEISLKNAPGK
ncbi:protein of unknown function DUF116 [Desulfonatronospira thiodismutans ASO3-1]|uniref:DUF116 domain-containing protein n=1 Tax=Desulfonatronospira thiodismutans ASO3-1 TaxID=555779 RepID=D6SQG3_9BACT|nr:MULTISPECIES: DUF116 domain-containing protein [Desulfonatronospira]EFI34989.1 protein of unknown function DUF116 [Desulfonatronospira thiodismutans ASO3-1]